LKKYQLKLECIFGVKSRKLLKFLVSNKDSDVDLDKVKTIQVMPTLETKKEAWSFIRHLNYIARFISQLTNVCDLIFLVTMKEKP